MIPVNKVLAAVLAAQVGLAVITWLPSGGEAAQVHTLVDYEADAVTRLEIVGRMSPEMSEAPAPIIVQRAGDGWTLESAGGYPAKADAIEPIVASLASITVRAPVGTTEGAHAALQVADDQFTRKVTLTSGGESTTLYLGAASGSAMQVRLDGTAEVYPLRGVTAWSVPDSPRRFFDSAYFKAGLDELSSFRIKNAQGDHTVLRLGGQWASEEIEDPSKLHIDELDALARSLLSVRMSEPVGREVKPEYGLDGGVEVEARVNEGDQTVTRSYRVGASAGDKKRYLKASDSDWVVTVLESGIIRAIETDFKFLDGPPPEEADSQPPGGFFGGGG